MSTDPYAPRQLLSAFADSEEEEKSEAGGESTMAGSPTASQAPSQADTLRSIMDTMSQMQQDLNVLRGASTQPPAAAGQGGDWRALQQQIDSLTGQISRLQINTPGSAADVSMRTASPLVAGSVAAAHTPQPPNLKLVSCEKFEAKERYAGLGLGFGFEDFVRRYEHAIQTDIETYRSRWTDRTKMNFMVKFMAIKPAKFFHDNIGDWKSENALFSYSDLKKKMRQQYGCRLSSPELIDRMREKKKKHQTWLEYLEYLKCVGDKMGGDTDRLVLETFVLSACPAEASSLSVLVNLEAINLRFEMEKALQHLYRVRGDGTTQNQTEDANQKSGKPRHHQSNKPKNDGNRGTASVAQGAEATPKPRLCFSCGSPDHLKRDCPKRQPSTGRAAQAAAVVAPTVTPTEPQGRVATCIGEYANSSDDDFDPSTYAACWSTTVTRDSDCTQWLLDSGASHHITDRREIMVNVKDCILDVTVANGNVVRATKKGDVPVTIEIDGVATKILFTDVFLIPEASGSLLSVSQLMQRGVVTNFDDAGAVLTQRLGNTTTVLARAPWKNGLCYLRAVPTKQNAKEGSASLAVAASDTLMGWHERLGHLNVNDVARIENHGLATGIHITSKTVTPCEPCKTGKQSRSSKAQYDTSTSAPTDEIGSVIGVDLKVNLKPQDRHGNQHVLHIVDYGSGYGELYPIRTKDAWLPHFQHFVTTFERQYDLSVKVVRSDNEFMTTKLREWCGERGTRLQSTETDESSSNGKIERRHRTVFNAMRACMFATPTAPRNLWSEAAKHQSWLRNVLPTRSNPGSRSPIEMLTGKKPDLSHVLPWGQRVSTHVKSKTMGTHRKGDEGLFVGYDPESKGCRVYIKRTKKIIITQHVETLGRQPAYKHKVAETSDGDDTDDEFVNVFGLGVFRSDPSDAVDDNSQRDEGETVYGDDSTVCDDSGDDNGTVCGDANDGDDAPATLQPRRSQRERRPPAKFGFPVSNVKSAFVTAPLTDTKPSTEPATLREALSGPDRELWRAAIQEELDALIANDTWDVVDTPPKEQGVNVVTSKYVFKIKRGGLGEFERCKVRLVARGFTQVEGVDYEETYSAVIRIGSVYFVFSMASLLGLIVVLADVPNAYVKGKMIQIVYMRAPAELGLARGKLLRLKKPLYGLKQSGRCWNDSINEFLISIGFRKCKFDPCVYILQADGGLVLLGLYVDDILLAGSTRELIDRVTSQLFAKYDIKSGPPSKFLGMNVVETEQQFSFGQPAMIDEILARFNMTHSKPVATPMDSNTDYNGNDEPYEDIRSYREAVGRLMWVANATRPDIAYAVGYAARHREQPQQSHWQLIKRIIRYLKGTRDFGVKFPKQVEIIDPSELELTIWSDADWAGDKSDRKSTSGAVLMINGRITTWTSRKQPVVALSTMEAEFIAGAQATSECGWIRQFVEDLLGVSCIPRLMIDNKSAIQSIKNQAVSNASKHIAIRFHFIRDEHREGRVDIQWCASGDQLADIMTKPLPRVLFERQREAIGVTAV